MAEYYSKQGSKWWLWQMRDMSLNPAGVPRGRWENLSHGEPGVPALTRVLSRDRSYRLVAVGPYDSPHGNGIYAIWQLTPAA